ncbi:MAG: polyphosphate kinase 1 [Verrucomicrobiae bacterium]|nr:polyphosphate kinase 1 [Verrucomicrobiae bacterium]
MSKRVPILNRELSWLEFNARVLSEALNPANPLLERLKFLAIFSNNLDEFFMVRVGGLQQLLESGVNTPCPAGLTTRQQLDQIGRRVRELVAAQYECLLQSVEPGLAAAGIRRLSLVQLAPEQKQYLERVCEQQGFPVITPVALKPGAAFPLVPGLAINLGVRLAPAKGARAYRFALLTLPRTLTRFIRLPGEQGYDYLLLEDLISLFLDRLFPGESIVEIVPFRVTRNADMTVREDLAGDLLARMKEVLRERRQSACVRLEVARPMSEPMREFFEGALKVDDEKTYHVPGPLDLAACSSLATMGGFDHLKVEPWPPQTPPDVRATDSMFDVIARKNVLLFHPYESFEPVVRLVDQAADDPDVLAIKQILYRTSRDSPIIAALARAAQKGKHVTALVELKARFDEARNIEWATTLEQAGVQVIYGLRGLKVHAKLCIIVRREPGGIRRYLHFGTGNYNEITAQLYSDVSFLTCDPDYGADASAFFNTITGYSQPVKYGKLEAAPLGLRERLLALIDGERQRAAQKQPARILAKLNSLVDTEIIRALYAASRAGVKIQLNVRGICCLRPGVVGLSENITVISILDRFLEHARIFYFHRGGEGLVFISSADWMPRNLDRRVELLVPVEDDACRARLISILETSLGDNVKARRMLPDGRYERVKVAGKAKPLRSQEAFYRQACAAAAQAKQRQFQTFEPQLPASSAR